MKTRRRSSRRLQRGSVLLIAIIVVASLTMLGLIAIRSTGVDTQVAGAEMSSEAALYISEAGIQWALQELDLTYNINPSSPNYSAIEALPVVTASDPWGPPEIVGWYELHSGQESMAYGRGAYRVVAKVAEPPDQNTLLIRCLGIAGAATVTDARSRRLLEVAVQPQPQ